jgi:plastocyanin
VRAVTRSPLVALACLVLLATGCGGGDDEAAGGGGEPEAARTTDDGALWISMDDLEFKPSDVTMRVGDKVTWVNDESIPHNVVSEDGTLRSDTFGKDGSYSYTARQRGTTEYVCTLHRGMDGRLTVE